MFLSPSFWSGFAILFAFLSATISLGADKKPWLMKRMGLIFLGFSGVGAVISGLIVLLSHNHILITKLMLGLPWLHWQIRLDALSGFFLTLIGIITIAVSFYGPQYVSEYENSNDSLSVLGFFSGLFVAGMMMVVMADDAFMFMVSWELMSLSSYFLVSYQHENSANRRASFIYLLMAHIGALCILLGYGVLAADHGFSFEAMRAANLDPTWATVAFILAFIGFGMKAGLVPIHAWLPEAHPVAPSHISALMSGVMLKVAVYGFIRFTFDLLGDIQWGWGVAVLIIGSLSAIMGVLYALMQHDLKKLLAYHSVENIGIIYIGLGLALIFEGTGNHSLAALGLVAALYHTLNHALFKSLLFLGAGSILHTTHQKNMEHMGGLIHKMPWTGLFFLIGCISISALPPFNGFVSEWLTFQAALQTWVVQNGILRTLIPVSAAILALTGALAATCFVKVYGVCFLGQARSNSMNKATEVGLGMKASQSMLALLCLFFGVLPTFTIEVINHIPQLLLGHQLNQATAHGWLWLTPISENVASYSAPLVLIGLILAWSFAAWWMKKGKVKTIKKCEPWDCGFSTPNARMQYTATAFAMPIRRVFGLLFNIHESVVKDAEGNIKHELHVEDKAWNWFYAPLGRITISTGRLMGKLQTGSIRNYLGWTLATLVVLLWVIS